MSAATFTPGPWDFHTADNAPVPHIAIEDQATNRLADVYFGAKGAAAGATAEANARLIAAAPELLEACKLAFARLKPGDIRKDYAGHIAVAAMSKAIAKAEGSAD